MKNSERLILIKELKKGEDSDFIKNFDWKAFLKKLHEKYIKKDD